MRSRDSAPPVHVHVPETTPVHVHMSPSRTPQNLATGDAGRPKVRQPWIPPGRPSSRRPLGSSKRQPSRVQHQSESGIRRQRDADDDFAAVSQNLSVLLREQESIRSLQKCASGGQHRAPDVLLRCLVEAEIDGVAVANQLTALKETLDGLAKDKRLSKAQVSSVGRQRQLLLEKMQMLDSSNHSLRELLREWSHQERERLVWMQHRDALKEKMDHCEAENMRLLARLTNKEKEVLQLSEHLDFEKDNAKTTEELSRILQSTTNHLECELERAEAEKVRLAAQIQKMQQNHQQQQEELRVLQEELQTVRQQQEEDEEQKQDQETLLLLTQQADRAEEANRKLSEKLQEKEVQLSQALSTSSLWCLRQSQEAAARGQLEEDVSVLRKQVTELNSQLRSVEEKSRLEKDQLRDQLHHLSSENASTQLDNQKLKADVTSCEEKLRELQSEARHLKSSIRKYEHLLEKYKKKVQQARLESEESRLKLEEAQKEALELKGSLEREKEQLRRELLARIRELEELPDRLRRSQQQLRDAQQEADGHQRRNLENSAALAGLRHKVEQQGAQLETFQQRNLLLLEENNVLKEKIHNLERRLEDLKAENKETLQTLSLKEADVGNVEQQLEEKRGEVGMLSRQLQQALDDAQRQVDGSMQRVLVQEKTSQSKALELQSQLSRARTDLSQVQRSKEEMERRFQSQLQNMKERLEQSDSTNRSLQNYVHFLKTSYGNVFGESLLTS